MVAEGRECPRRVRTMALRLVADFHLREDVLPWLRARRAGTAGAGGGGGAGALLGGQAGAWRHAIYTQWGH